MVIQIEPKTRQWLGLVIVGGIIAGMIFAGLILPVEYDKYTGLLVGALFYHIVRMLNTPAPSDHVADAGKMVSTNPANPTQSPEG